MTPPVSRRNFLQSTTAALAAASTAGVLPLFAQKPAPLHPTIALAPLPFPEKALEPYISGKTVSVHYHKHHTGYFTVLKAWIEKHPEFQNRSIEELISSNTIDAGTIRDFLSFFSNHNWYWQSLKPKGGGKPGGKMGAMVKASFGSFENFRKAFIDAGMAVGIGFVWLVQDRQKLTVNRLDYYSSPYKEQIKPLAAIDVWEHAYYLDYQNDRQPYLEAIVDHLLNWEFVEKNWAVKKSDG